MKSKDFKPAMTLICRGSFPAELDGGSYCTVESSVYRANAPAVNTVLLDGTDAIRQLLELPEEDTYITRHDIDDIVTVVRIIREG